MTGESQLLCWCSVLEPIEQCSGSRHAAACWSPQLIVPQQTVDHCCFTTAGSFCLCAGSTSAEGGVETGRGDDVPDAVPCSSGSGCQASCIAQLGIELLQ
jgi:hypothetical protein